MRLEIIRGVGEQMNEKFFDLKKEKQDRMINAALKVFGEHGFKRASTDEMVKEAEISKGLLFHYFESKQGLYEFVLDYSIRYMMLELASVANGRETDYFELHKQILYARLAALKNYPYMQIFINSVMAEKQEEISLEIIQKRYDYQEFYHSIFEKADTTRLYPTLDVDRLSKMLEFTLVGLMKEQDDPETTTKEMLKYIDMLKRVCTK